MQKQYRWEKILCIFLYKKKKKGEKCYIFSSKMLQHHILHQFQANVRLKGIRILLFLFVCIITVLWNYLWRVCLVWESTLCGGRGHDAPQCLDMSFYFSQTCYDSELPRSQHLWNTVSLWRVSEDLNEWSSFCYQIFVINRIKLLYKYRFIFFVNKI